MRKEILIIGVGNDIRGDDAMGLIVARNLRERALQGVRVIEEKGDGGMLMELWEGAQCVIVVDAIASEGIPGEIIHIDAIKKPLPQKFFRYSTHAFSLAEAVELARTLGRLPSQLFVYGIEGSSFAIGTGLSLLVQSKMPELVKRIEKDVRELLGRRLLETRISPIYPL